MSKTIEVRQAKASPDDIRRMLEFFEFLENAIEYGILYPDCDGEGERMSPDRLEEEIRKHWGEIGPGIGAGTWQRIVYGCSMLISNCCDPDLDYLEWRPDVKAWLESQEADSDD